MHPAEASAAATGQRPVRLRVVSQSLDLGIVGSARERNSSSSRQRDWVACCFLCTPSFPMPKAWCDFWGCRASDSRGSRLSGLSPRGLPLALRLTRRSDLAWFWGFQNKRQQRQSAGRLVAGGGAVCLSAGCQSDAGARAPVGAGVPHRCTRRAEVLAGVWLPWHYGAAFMPDVKAPVHLGTGMQHHCLAEPRFWTWRWLLKRSLPAKCYGPGWGPAAHAPPHVGTDVVRYPLWSFLPLLTP